jgi:hypothetical protein
MGPLSEPHDNEIMTDEQWIDLYEQLRAAEKNPALDYPFSDQTMQVKIDWDALERRALRPSLPERVRDAFFTIPPRVLAVSIVGPVIGLLVIFFWLRTVPAGFTEAFVVRAAFGAAFMVLMFVWASISMQAMDRMMRTDVRDLILRSAMADAPAPSASSSLFEPIRLLGSPQGVSFAFFAMIAISLISAMALQFHEWGDLRPQPARRNQTPEQMAADPGVLLLRDDLQAGSMSVGAVLATGPSKNRLAFYKAADQVYYQLMSVPTSDPHADELRDVLADQTLKSLLLAKDANPESATIWTRLAEVYYLKGDIAKAQNAIDCVKGRDGVPPLERARAQMIAGYIDARDISSQFRTAGPRQRIDLASRLDQAIGGIQKSSQEAGADASAVLTHLYLARAAATADPRERKKRRDQAIEFSFEAINAATVLRTVERPASLTTQFALAKRVEKPEKEMP